MANRESATPMSNPTVTSTSTDLLPIISGQRDRYKARCDALENDMRALQTAHSDTQHELERLRRDNLQLYERIRYMSNYSTGGNAHGNAAGNMGGNGEVTDRYRGMYEAEMDPFQRFHRSEERRRLSRMDTADRATLNLTKFFLSSRRARHILFFYAVALHLLVVFVLYRFILIEECRHDHEFIPAPK